MKMFFESLNRKDSHDLTDQIASKFAEAAGPYRDKLKTLVADKSYAALACFDIDYTSLAVEHVIAARSVIALYQKNNDLDLGIDTEFVAFEKFIEAERVCALTNERFSRDRLTGPHSPVVSDVLNHAETIIKRILGEFPSFAELQLAYGPGASSNVSKNTSARWKLSAKPECSSNLASSLSQVLAEMPHYCDLHSESTFGVIPDSSSSIESPSLDLSGYWRTEVAVVPGKLSFVPKNAKTDRAIIIEPTLNSLVQKGYGTFMKARLMKAGVNLYDQTLNQSRARIGSLDGSLMTIDLSSASDTIAKQLVSRLLPVDWYIGLSEARTSHIVYARKLDNHDTLEVELYLDKFSSMGNGFTFELESLIFYALTVGCCRFCGVKPDVSVYGDDIICPPSILDTLVEVFQYCGFSINKSKSFSTGCFRESCGADYYSGVNVRPFYLKSRWSPAAITIFHNFLVRSSLSLMFPDIVELMLRNLPEQFQNYGPDGYGDGHLIGDWHPRPLKRDRGWGGFVFDTFIQRPLRFFKASIGDSILPVYSVYIGSTKEDRLDPFAERGKGREKRISVYTLSRF